MYKLVRFLFGTFWLCCLRASLPFSFVACGLLCLLALLPVGFLLICYLFSTFLNYPFKKREVRLSARAVPASHRRGSEAAEEVSGN